MTMKIDMTTMLLAGTGTVPSIDDVVQDESGTLERPEVVRALIKTIPRLNGRDEAWLTGMFATIWSLFDPNGDGERYVGSEMPLVLYYTIMITIVLLLKLVQ